jgi:succinate dehydrogenase/fumarate reductase cytochrome b subunit
MIRDTTVNATTMNATLLRGLIALVPAGMLLAGALILFRKARTASSVLQIVGAGCLALVVLAHICEGLRLLSWMHWGLEHSTGHYLDLSSAVVGLTLFPVGYFWTSLRTAATCP